MRPIQKIMTDASRMLGLSTAHTRTLEPDDGKRKPGRPADPNSLKPFSAMLHPDEIFDIRAFASQHHISISEAARVMLREGIRLSKQGKLKIETAPMAQKVVFR